MHIFYYPDKDATIYQVQNTQNTGLDEILEVEKAYYNGTLREVARTLIKFDLAEISSSITTGTITSPRFWLNLKTVQASQIPLSYTLHAYPVSQSWEMGVGTKFDGVTNTGVSWLYRDSSDSGSLWVSGSTAITGSLAVNTTGSVDGSGGGTWYTSSAASQSFEYESTDLRMEVTNIVQNWLSGSIPNQGFILKHSFSVEEDSQDYGTLQFFSRDTNTIFPPTLEVAWNDSTLSTGSINELTEEERVVKIKNIRTEYQSGSRARFRLLAREYYPQKSFGTGSPYSIVKYLPTSSYYSIKDAETEHTLIPFDDYTQLSVDASGSYFDQWISFQPERFYRVIIKTEKDGLIDYYDNDQIFKVVR